MGLAVEVGRGSLLNDLLDRNAVSGGRCAAVFELGCRVQDFAVEGAYLDADVAVGGGHGDVGAVEAGALVTADAHAEGTGLGEEQAFNTVLAECRERDTFTLWQMLSRVEGDRRVKVLNRMIELVGLPASVTREDTLKLDKNTLDAWKDEMDTVWF